tara:strand:- start:37 stop:591 length:555 start_codon:yes stop_codon:yes gene_type:complete
MSKRYQIIYADPPWDYKGQTQHGGKGSKGTGGASSHYPTMQVKDMKKWDLSQHIDQTACLLYMWTSSPHLDQAIELMKAWGFKWATIAFVWDKEMVNPGYYTMSQCELVLLGKRGKIPQPRGLRNVRQLVSSKRGKHSQKPEEVRQRIEQMFPSQEKLEMFARKLTVGWDAWGNEIDGVQLNLE